MKHRILLPISLTVLMIGAVPYVLWEQNIMLLQTFKDILPKEIEYRGNIIEMMVRNYLGDFSWAISLILFQEWITEGRINFLTYCACFLPFICEMGQLGGLIPGTFDIIDLIIYFTIILTYLLWKEKQF